MSIERRESYRVRSDGVSIRAHLLLPALAGWVAVDVLDTSARGLGVLVPESIAAHLPVGRIEKARIHVAATRRELEVRVAVRNARPVPGGHAVGLEILDVSGLHTGAPPQVHALFNRRRSLRVRPTPQHPLRVTLTIGRQREVATVFDLATEGISALVQRPLVIGTSLTLELHVVREDLRAVCRAMVAHRLQTGSGVRYGFAFDKAHLGYGGTSDVAARYVQERQRELLQLPNA